MIGLFVCFPEVSPGKHSLLIHRNALLPDISRSIICFKYIGEIWFGMEMYR